MKQPDWAKVADTLTTRAYSCKDNQQAELKRGERDTAIVLGTAAIVLHSIGHALQTGLEE